MDSICRKFRNSSFKNSQKRRCFFLDSEFNLDSHINAKTKACYAQLHSISKIRKYLSVEAAKTIVHAFVTSRLDNLNSILANPQKNQVTRLQKIQNSAARLVLRQNKYCHITPLLRSLHWLPVAQRIEFKILLLVFKCYLGQAPSYLQSLIVPYTQPRYVRFQNSFLCKCHKQKVRRQSIFQYRSRSLECTSTSHKKL